ncbi:MAG: hypothetical protein ACLQBB_15830 [Solirubrobacteraceae bacterium]
MTEPPKQRVGRERAAIALRVALAAVLGAAAALLVACGSSGKGLIPAAQGGPLQGDIEAVEQAAERGNGNCSATESALLKTEQDFAALPATLNGGLHDNLRQGIENLHKVALTLCTQPLTQAATTTTPKTSTTTTTPTTTTSTTPTTPTTPATTPTTPTTPAEKTEAPGGGTPAPGEGQGKAPGEGVGGAGVEEKAPGNGAGGSEGGK